MINKKISIISYVAIFTIANILLYNLPLFSFSLSKLNGFEFNTIKVVFILFVIIFTATTFILFLISMISKKLLKLFSVIVVTLNSFALYFIITYQVLLDRTMMGNITNTRPSEAGELLSLKLFLYVFFLGVIPTLLIIKIRLKPTKRTSILKYMIAILVAGITCIYLSSSSWLWLDKHAKQLGGMVMPWSYVANMTRHQLNVYKSSQELVLLPTASFLEPSKKTVVVLVIGEAARAKNFSLYDYEKNTNPLLSQTSVIPLKNTLSCSTYTTESIRCMLSHQKPGSQYSKQYEPLPSYLQRHGVDVIWRSNNWGEPPLEVTSYESAGDLRRACAGDGCKYDDGAKLDSALLIGLEERINASEKNKIFVVLHQNGSHGPAYYKKYPEKFEVFKPACKTIELNKCENKELINAYDNTILYTDYLLNEVIEILKNLEGTSSMFMYASDHGESLGESGLYLHGTPYSLAPKEQIEIPFLTWMSPEFITYNGISVETVKRKESHAHANIFHSVMRAFNMQSKIYNEQLNIFKGNKD